MKILYKNGCAIVNNGVSNFDKIVKKLIGRLNVVTKKNYTIIFSY